MMSPSYIRAISTSFAAAAELTGLVPYLVTAGELQTWAARVARGGLQQLPFPTLGDEFEPAGWTETRQLFCDASGFGTESEAALTNRGLVAELKPGFAYGIGDVGQFQLYIREFEPTSETETEPDRTPCDHCGCTVANLYTSPYNNAQYCATCYTELEPVE